MTQELTCHLVVIHLLKIRVECYRAQNNYSRAQEAESREKPVRVARFLRDLIRMAIYGIIQGEIAVERCLQLRLGNGRNECSDDADDCLDRKRHQVSREDQARSSQEPPDLNRGDALLHRVPSRDMHHGEETKYRNSWWPPRRIATIRDASFKVKRAFYALLIVT